MPDLAGGVQRGYTADLAVIDGNPLDDLKVMYRDGREHYLPDLVTRTHRGGVRWTIRNGVVFDAQALLKEVEDYVQEERANIS